MGIVVLCQPMAIAQMSHSISSPIKAINLEPAETTKEYRYNHPYFFQDVSTIISGYSKYYDLSRIKYEIIATIGELAIIDNTPDNQEIIQQKIKSALSSFKWISDALRESGSELSRALDDDNFTGFLFRYPLAETEYRILLRRAQFSAASKAKDQFSRNYEERKAQIQLDSDLTLDIIKHDEFYLAFARAAALEMGSICLAKEFQC